MSLVINAPLVEGKLRDEAAKLGLSAAEYAVTILTTHLAPEIYGSNEAPFYATATSEEWNKAFDTWVASHSTGPSLPDSALTRESMYEGRA